MIFSCSPGKTLIPFWCNNFQWLLEGLPSHDRTMHLLLWQAAQIISNLLISYSGCIFNCFTFDNFGQNTGRSNGAGTAKGLEFGIFDGLISRVDFQSEFKDITADNAADFSHGIRVFNFPDIFRVLKCSITLSV